MATPKRRMQRIFKADGKALIVAMDHAAGMSVKGLEDPSRVIRQLVAGGMDAIITTFGTARRFSDLLGDRGLILSADNQTDVSSYAVENALRLGADAVKVEAFPDSPNRPLTMSNLARLGSACEGWGMPLLAEMIPVSYTAKEAHTPANISRVARMGAEAGADFVKVHYTGDPESFRDVVGNCYVPILILGGPRGGESDADTLAIVKAAMEAGACGVAIGRKIWGHSKPEGMTAALAAIIHEGASVQQALKELETVKRHLVTTAHRGGRRWQNERP